MQAKELMLINKIKDGDQFAFEYVFKQHHKKMLFFAKRYVKDDVYAKELVNDVFTNLWRIRKKLEIKKSLEGYLLRSAHNHCLNFLRSQKNNLTFYSNEELILLENEFEYLQQKDILEKLFNDELQQKLKEEVSRLPAQQQKIFKLSRYDRLSVKEIAEKLGISDRTVENHIHLALKALKVFINKILNI